nr:hypothetical protein [Tanacetum cinerariifolium]
MLATMNQIANLLSGLQKQFPPTNNQLRTSSNPKTHATVHDGYIVTETVQRRAPSNTGTKGIQNTGSGVNNSGKKVICYNCRGEGHVARQCKEPKHARYSQWYHDKALLMQATEKRDVLDAEAEAFLADVECPENIITRRFSNDLIDFSGETLVPRYMRFFLDQKITKTRRFMTHKCKEAEIVGGCIVEMTALVAKLHAMDNQDEVYNGLLAAKDAKRGEESKLVALNNLIVEALDDIDMLETDMEILGGDDNGV